MFGHDDQNDSGAPVVNPTSDTSSSSLPFDPSTVSLGDNGDQDAPATSPALPHDEPVSQVDDTPAAAPVVDTPAAPAATDDDLISIKQSALQQLSPLVGHLDQTPEEKFRTTMMMIQASDDQSLIKAAYDAAQAITDDKVRAQSLLDIINEINYFTQQHQE